MSFEGVSWKQVTSALLLYRHERECKRLSRRAARVASQGYDVEAKALEEYLRVKRELWLAAERGDYDRVVALRASLSKLEKEYPFIFSPSPPPLFDKDVEG